MFTLSNGGDLLFNDSIVQHEGETLKGTFNFLSFDNKYFYLTSLKNDVNSIINDYINCTNNQNFDVSILKVTFN